MEDAFRDEFESRQDPRLRAKAQQWFVENLERLRPLGSNEYLRRYLFEPFNSLLDSFGETTEEQVKRTITQVAIAGRWRGALCLRPSWAPCTFGTC